VHGVLRMSTFGNIYALRRKSRDLDICAIISDYYHIWTLRRKSRDLGFGRGVTEGIVSKKIVQNPKAITTRLTTRINANVASPPSPERTCVGVESRVICPYMVIMSIYGNIPGTDQSGAHERHEG